MAPAWRCAATEQLNPRNVAVEQLQAVANFPRFLAVRAERAVYHLLNAGVLALQPGAAGGNQHVFGIGAGMVAAVHARLCIQQVKEVVKVGHISLCQSLGNAQLSQLVQLHPGESLHRAHRKAPALGQLDSLLVVGAGVPHRQYGVIRGELPYREPLHIEQAHGGVVIDGGAVADRVPVRPGRVGIDK